MDVPGTGDKKMKKVIGALMMVAGVILGIYVGLYLMFIGGIIDVIDGAKAEPTDGSKVAWGVVKFLFGGVVGEMICVIMVMAGAAMWGRKSRKQRKNTRW